MINERSPDRDFIQILDTFLFKIYIICSLYFVLFYLYVICMCEVCTFFFFFVIIRSKIYFDIVVRKPY